MAASPDRRPSRDRDPQSGQARRDARPAGALRRRCHISGRARACPSRRKPARRFRANARIKAEAAAKASNMPAFADDSGLAVDALDGQPGIHSARWAGPDKDFRFAMNKIQSLLIERGAKTAERRRGHFVSALCVAWPDGHVEEFEATVDGTVVWPPRGTLGFGYDPLFLPDGQTQHLRRDVERGEARPAAAWPRPVAPRPRLPQARGGVSCANADATFGVYVHWPFCLSKCPYCDFNSHVRHAAIDEPRFLRAFQAEIAATAARSARPHRVEHLLRRRHAVADAARHRRHDPRHHRQALDRAAECRGHARSQSDQRRGDALSRLSRGRRQPRLARRAGARRCVAERARPDCTPRRRRSTPSPSRENRSTAIRSI